LNRRSFVNRLLAGAAGGLCLPGRAFGKGPSKAGLQLYTVRRELESDFEGTLARVAALGVREVEFAGYYKQPPRRIREVLARHGLSAPSAHVRPAELRDGLEAAIEAARIIGHRYLVCGYVPAEERRSLDDYKRLAELLNRSGERARRAGVQLGYHNHDFEFAPLEGRLPYDLILAEADARLVRMEMDLYWITKAGHSPQAYFRRHPGRFQLLHVKDMDRTPRRFFTEVGRGVIDFKGIFAEAGRAGVRHYFVEQDETPGSPFSSIEISLNYLRQLKL
jgi:sugar phosphate isomerase/epimerase